jgi:Cdc6-like AAA superfamily ATPase
LGGIQKADAIVEAIRELVANRLATYGPLLLVVGPYGSGKTSLLRRLAEEDGYEYHNVSLELASVSPTDSSTRTPFSIPEVLRSIVGAPGGKVSLLDHIELLFVPPLQLDVLRLLRDLSRTDPLVVAWPGEYKVDKLTYAQPGHPEFREYRQPESWPGVKVLSLRR